MKLGSDATLLEQGSSDTMTICRGEEGHLHNEFRTSLGRAVLTEDVFRLRKSQLQVQGALKPFRFVSRDAKGRKEMAEFVSSTWKGCKWRKMGNLMDRKDMDAQCTALP